MKFLHVADLHLDREFEGLKQKVVYKPYKILEEITDFSIEESVDFLVLAGDNFHQSKPSIKMQNYFIQELKKLETAGITVFLIFGNHDYYRQNTYWFDFPKNVQVFYSQDIETKYFQTGNGEKIAVSAFSYLEPHISQNKIKEYPKRDYSVDYHIGIFHGELGGSSYAPTTITDINIKNYDYWALGHIHLQSNIADNIIYPGTPIGRNRKEITSQVALVELTDTGMKLELVDLSPTHWKNETIDLSGLSTLSQVMFEIRQHLEDESNFYSLYFSNYQDIKEQLKEALTSGELVDSLRAEGKVIVKTRLLPLEDSNSKHEKIDLPLDALSHLDFYKLAENLPRNIEIQKIISEDFLDELESDLSNFIDENFNFQGGSHEN
ncbi:hypothetical protein BG262_01510 [Floricoccus penangensis]|uniref:Calcineurin-like phosphoesterase domain-containing protein n=1 Tax=Floricoccus penangensis TaxID=1859475 RepID=A0A9Q5JGR9_9LACT|nr:metallophosphoesterase [Floricoccus penangensis]OFI47035.1 hypothetical protein BG262_01510 [Floricoccus penangensis]